MWMFCRTDYCKRALSFLHDSELVGKLSEFFCSSAMVFLSNTPGRERSYWGKDNHNVYCRYRVLIQQF